MIQGKEGELKIMKSDDNSIEEDTYEKQLINDPNIIQIE